MINPINSSSVNHVNNIQVSFKEISSGKKNVSFYSPALLEIGRKLLINSNLAGVRNSNILNEISMSQTESSFVQNAQDSLSRLSELAVHANSGVLSAGDKEALQTEANELVKHLDYARKNARFNGKDLLNDEQFAEISENLANIDFSTSEGIAAAATAAEQGLASLADRQAELGSEQIALEERFSANMAEQNNLLQAGSKLTDTDISKAYSRFSSDVILNDVAMAMQAQAIKLQSSTLSALLKV